MKTLDRYLAAQIARTFALVVLAFIVLFTVIDYLTHRRGAIVDNEVPWTIVGEYYAALAPQLLIDQYFGGLAALLASLLVLGTFSQRNELTAALAGGISLVRVVRAPLLFGAVLSLAAFACANLLGPGAARTVLDVESQYLGRPGAGDEMQRGPVSWANLDGGWTCHVGKFNRVALSGEDALFMVTHDGSEELVRAERLYWDRHERAWIIEDGLWAIFYPDKGMQGERRRITLERAPISETPEELFAPMESPGVRSLPELRQVILAAERRGVPSNRLEVEWHARFARAAMPFVMVCIAVPLSARIRKQGRSAGIGLAVLLGLTYFMIAGATLNLGLNGRLDPPVAVWVANVLFLFTGFVLYLRTPR